MSNDLRAAVPTPKRSPRLYRSFALLPALLAVALLVACRPSPTQQRADDEAELRKSWVLPADASLVNLVALPPTGGTFGREGLRLLATFQAPLTSTQDWLNSHRPDEWAPLPLHPAILALQAGPVELPPNLASGQYICDVRTYATPLPPFTPFNPNTTTGPLAAYRVAAADPATGRIAIIEKRYY